MQLITIVWTIYTAHFFVLVLPRKVQYMKIKYLSVVSLIDSKLTFNTQVNSVCKRANSALLFLRNLYSCQREVKAEAYQVYVRPILEYAGVPGFPMLNAILIT